MARRDSLKRRPAMREPRRRFTLFCEGSKTEPGYFEAIRMHHKDALIEVNIVAAGAVPMTLATRAVEARKAQLKRGNSHESDDEIWIVVDRDTHPHFDKAMKLCEVEGVRVARSNPCFELWLILHYEHYDMPSDAAVASQACALSRSTTPTSSLSFDQPTGRSSCQVRPRSITLS